MPVLTRSLTYGDLSFCLDHGVAIPDAYSVMLAESIQIAPEQDVLDLTTGCGFHAIIMAKAGANVTAIDCNRRAVSLTRRNAARNQLSDRVACLVGDLFAPLGPSCSFDHIVAWPPVMPTPPARLRHDAVGLAHNGGADGRMVLDRIITAVTSFLKPGGSLWLCHPWYLDLDDTKERLTAVDLNVSVVASKDFPFGLLSFERLDYIVELGRRPKFQGGVPVQTMSVLRATW